MNEIKEVEQDLVLSAEKKEITPKRGRPKGSKNKDTIFKELMNEDFQALATQEVGKVFKVLFDEAKDGNMQAIKMLMDRVVPVTKAVDLADMDRSGLTIEIKVGNLEDTVGKIEKVDITGSYEEIEDDTE